MGRRKGGGEGFWPKRMEKDFLFMTKGFLDGSKRNSGRNSRGNSKEIWGEFQGGIRIVNGEKEKDFSFMNYDSGD